MPEIIIGKYNKVPSARSTSCHFRFERAMREALQLLRPESYGAKLKRTVCLSVKHFKQIIAKFKLCGGAEAGMC
jgi:hypothetical protein